MVLLLIGLLMLDGILIQNFSSAGLKELAEKLAKLNKHESFGSFYVALPEKLSFSFSDTVFYLT